MLQRCGTPSARTFLGSKISGIKDTLDDMYGRAKNGTVIVQLNQNAPNGVSFDSDYVWVSRSWQTSAGGKCERLAHARCPD